MKTFLNIALTAFFGLILGLSMAQAEETAGWVQEVAGEVTLAGTDGAARPAEVEAAVMLGDVVKTGPASRVQIMLRDKTALALGEKAEFSVLDALDANGLGSLDMRLTTGVARFVTSQVVRANPEKFRLETPLGYIGVRGTEFGSLIDPGREVHLLYQGGPVVYTDSQFLGTLSDEARAELCGKIDRALNKSETVLCNLGAGEYTLSRQLKAQILQLKAYQQEFRCGQLKADSEVKP